MPPNISSVKVHGQRAYKLYRDSGKDLNLQHRQLRVESLSLVERKDEENISLEMTCGKGGYVRSIARDLGKELGCFGHVTKLNRSKSGPFTLSDAIGYSFLLRQTPAYLKAQLFPIEHVLKNMYEYKCDLVEATKIGNGNRFKIMESSDIPEKDIWLSHANKPIAIGSYLNGSICPKRVFNTD